MSVNNEALDFKSYEKIPESTKKWNLTEKDYKSIKKIPWIAMEKIHGANFCFITDDKKILCAKRKKILKKEEDFFGHNLILDKLKNQIFDIFKFLSIANKNLNKVFIYGEIFGGCYPHESVKKNDRVKPVQTGVYYSPNIEFCAFDIAIEKNKNFSYLDYEEAIKIFNKVDMFYSKPLIQDKYEKVLNFPIEFSSTIPKLLGLPKLNTKNKAEGIVIKPIRNIYINTKKGLVRAILKKKISEFSESKEFHKAEKWEFSSDIEFLENQVDLLLTENRLKNAISKAGYKDKKEILQSFEQDILEQITEDNEKRVVELDYKEIKNLKLYINKKSKKFLKSFSNLFE